MLCAHVWPFYLDSSALCAERRVFYILFYFISFRTQIQNIRVCKHIYILCCCCCCWRWLFFALFLYLLISSLSLSVISCIIVLWFLSRTYSSTHNIQCFRLVVVTICFCFDFLARENINTIIYPNTLTHTHWFFMFSLYRPHFSRCLRFSFIFFVSLD